MTVQPETIKELEVSVARRPHVEVVTRLIDAYIDQREPRSLERALSLVLRHHQSFRDDSNFVQRATQVLTAIKDNAHAAKLAVELVDDLVKRQPDRLLSYGNAALIHWRVGDPAAAIEISELGLRKATDESEAEVALHLKGNLAYYYAERGFPQDAERARALAQAAYEARPTASRLDTLGYVLMHFARDRKDLELAQGYLMQAKEELSRTKESNPLLEAHIKEVAARLGA